MVGWVVHGTGVDEVQGRKILPLPGIELPRRGRPVSSQSLYRLRYPGSGSSYGNKANTN
jgi:hypothetical protein